MMKGLRLSAFASLLIVSGCAVHTYRPISISPLAQARGLESRSLDDSELQAWMKQAADFAPPSWPMPAWDLNALTLAAYYFNAQMDVARANAAVAEAAIETAAMKPNPSVGAGAGYETAPESPYMLGLNFSLPIETAGKRGYRIAEATHLSEASQLQVADTAWTVRSRVRIALVDLLFSMKATSVLRGQEALQSKYADLLEARFRAGEVPLPEVTAARIDLTNLRQALRTAEGQVGTAQAALAGAIGIPLSGLAGKIFNWTEVDQPPTPSALPAKEIRAAAIENRLDVQRTLAQFAAAQSRLQLEIARQYPDINLGPGYAFEEGAHLISLQLGTVLPVRNRNEGPIAEAEAQRKATGAQLLATQSTVIADSDKALTEYSAAYAVLEEARRSTAQLDEQRRTTYRWLKAGETDQLAAVSADLQATNAERAQLDAMRQAQLALGTLEDALQRPIAPGTAPALPKQAVR